MVTYQYRKSASKNWWLFLIKGFKEVRNLLPSFITIKAINLILISNFLSISIAWTVMKFNLTLQMPKLINFLS